MLRGRDVKDLEELKRQGLSLRAISRLTGLDRKTIHKYLIRPELPVYGPRVTQPGKLEGFKAYLEQRMQAGVWNGRVLLRELRGRGYAGGYTILTDWLRPQRASALVVALRRFETPPGVQAQVDWEHLGTLEMAGQESKLWGFASTLGYSRVMMAAALGQKLGTLLRMHEEAFGQLGGVPEEILYDQMRTVWSGMDERGEIVWNPVFLDFARYWASALARNDPTLLAKSAPAPLPGGRVLPRGKAVVATGQERTTSFRNTGPGAVYTFGSGCRAAN